MGPVEDHDRGNVRWDPAGPHGSGCGIQHQPPPDTPGRFESALHTPIGKAGILARVRSAEAGNFGDGAAVGGGVFEMRIHVGPGYRMYYCRRGEVTYLLLCGGDKASQRRDIRTARDILSTLENQA